MNMNNPKITEWCELTKELLKETSLFELIGLIEKSVEDLSDEQWKDGYPNYVFEGGQDE